MHRILEETSYIKTQFYIKKQYLVAAGLFNYRNLSSDELNTEFSPTIVK